MLAFSVAIGQAPYVYADLLSGDEHWKIIKSRKGLSARFTRPYRIEELVGDLNELPWQHWQTEGSFETGGRIAGEEPIPFHLEYGPRGEFGSGLFDSLRLSWNIDKDAGRRYVRWGNLLAREHSMFPLGPEGGRILISGDRSGTLIMRDGYRSGQFHLNDGKRLSWRWDDWGRYVLWSGLGTGFFWVSAIGPGRAHLNAASFTGNFQVGDLLLKPRVHLGGTRLSWNRMASRVSGGLYEQWGPTILSAEANFDQGRWDELETRVEEDLIPGGGSQEEWLEALFDLQDAVQLRRITVNPRLLDQRVDVGYRPADDFLHMIARDFPMIEVDLREVAHPIDVPLASQQITGLPLNHLLENQERLLLANFSQGLYGEKSPTYRQALSLGSSFGAGSSGSVQFLSQNDFLLENPLQDQAGGIRLGYRRGRVESLTPLFDGASTTQLGIRGADVDVAHIGWRHPVLTDPSLSIAVEGMAYVADFRGDVQIFLTGPKDPVREDFLMFRAPEGILLGEVAEEKVSGLLLPGGFLGVEASAFDEGLGLRYRRVPYLPIGMDDAAVREDGNIRGLLKVGSTIGYASDIVGFIKQPMLEREVFASFHKDAADRLETTSSLEVLPGIKAGIRLGEARAFGDLRTAFVNAQWGIHTAGVGLHQDEAHETRGYDFRVGRLWGGTQWETGMTLKHYLTGGEDGDFDPLLEREWMLRLSDPSGRQRLVLSYGEDTLAGKGNLFAGIERSISESLHWRSGAELTLFEEEESELRGSVGLRWVW